MSRLHLAALVVLLACTSQGDRPVAARAAPAGASRTRLAVQPEFTIAENMFHPANPGWLWRPGLAESGGVYLATWIVSDGVQTDVWGARVTADGAVLPPGPFAITTAPGDQKVAAVAGGDAGWLVTWVDLRSGLFPTGVYAGQGDIYGARVARDGTLLDPDGLPLVADGTAYSDPAAAWTGAGWLVTFQQSYTSIHGVLVGPAGDAGARFFVAAPTSGRLSFPELACGGGTCLEAWSSRELYVNEGDIEGVRIDGVAGAPLDLAPVPIATAPGDQNQPAISFDGRDFLVVFEDRRDGTGYEVWGARVSSAGGVLDPAGFPIARTDGAIPTRPSVAFDGRNHLVEWRDTSVGSEDVPIRVRAVGTDGALVGAEAIVYAGSPGSRFGRIASAGGDRALVIHTLDVYGTVPLFGAIVGDDAARPFLDLEMVLGPPTRLDLPTGIGTRQRPGFGTSDTGHLAVWQQAFSTSFNDTDLYAARIAEDGTVLDPGGIPVSTAPNRQGFQAVAWAGTSWVVLWEDARNSYLTEIYGARISPEGVVLDPGGVLIAGGDMVQRRAPELAFDGTNVVAVWIDGNTSIQGVLLDPTTLAPVGPRFLLGTFPLGAVWGYPRLACGGGVCMTHWSHRGTSGASGEGDVYAARVDGAGNVLDPWPIEVCVQPGDQRSNGIAWDGQRFVLTWSDARSGAGYDGYATWVTADGFVLDTDGFPVAEPRTDLVLLVNMPFDGTYHLVSWRDERNGFTQWHARLMDTAGVLYDPEFQVSDGPVDTTGARFGTTRPGRYVVQYGVLDETVSPSQSHAWVRSVELRPSVSTLTVVRDGTGAGTVDSSPAGIDCGASCAADFQAGTAVTLTARPAAGSVFAGWTGACAGQTGATCTVTMNEDLAAGATFAVITYPLTVRTYGTGRGTVTGEGISCTTGSSEGCTGSFPSGAAVALTATPDAASIFTGWSGCASVSGAVCSVTMTGARSVTATFQPAYFVLTVRAAGTGKGTVTGDGISCYSGSTCTASVQNTAPATVVTLTAVPDEGSILTGWTGCTSVVGGVCSVTMSGARSATATFMPAAWTLTVRTSGTGKGTVTGEGISCYSGSTCTVSVPNTSPATAVAFTAMPDPGSIFTSWSGCTSVSGNVCSVTVTSARTVTATFQPAEWLLTARASGTGKGTVTGSGIECTSGSITGCTAWVPNTSPATPVTLTATPDAASILTSWSGCTSVSGNACTVTMTSARTVTAVFAPATWLLNARTSGTGKGSITGPGIECTSGSTAGCTASVPNTSPATVVQLVATPDGMSSFTAWSGCTTVSGNVCNVTMASARTVTATFGVTAWPLTVTLAGAGTGSVTGGGLFCRSGSSEGCTAIVPNTSPATVVTLTAMPELGSTFSYWSGCSSASGTTCTVTMGAARNVTAVFDPPLVPLTVTITGNGRGTVTGPGISCSTEWYGGCSASFPVTDPPSVVTLTAVDVVEGIRSWTGCTPVAWNTCTVAVTGPTAVIVDIAGMPYPVP
jgi:hypothetical protein